MSARVPQDVDLEDKLVYGLSPLRFAYLVIAALGVLGCWRIEDVPAGARVVPCLVLALSGVLLAWGRWHGRSLDGWALDLVVFVRRNYCLQVSWGSRKQRRRAPVPLAAMRALRGGRSVAPVREPTPAR